MSCFTCIDFQRVSLSLSHAHEREGKGGSPGTSTPPCTPEFASQPAVLGSSSAPTASATDPHITAMNNHQFRRLLVESPGPSDGNGDSSTKSPAAPSRGAVLGARKSASIPMTPFVLPLHAAPAPCRTDSHPGVRQVAVRSRPTLLASSPSATQRQTPRRKNSGRPRQKGATSPQATRTAPRSASLTKTTRRRSASKISTRR